MRYKSLLYALLLCLVLVVTSACSPAAGPDGNRMYSSPAGPYDDDPGFKNDFQVSDLNPNMVTGTNDLYDRKADARMMAQLAKTVHGVRDANVRIIGGTAHINLNITKGADAIGIRGAVYDRVKFKMPRYQIDVESSTIGG